MRGRLAFEGLYPPRPLKDGGLKPTVATGNIFGLPESERSHFIRTNGFPIYDPSAHEVLFVLGCQGANSPEVQPVVLATARLLDAAGVKWGVLAEEKCWGEALLHAGGLLEDWPLWARERIESLTQALGGDRGRTILTICPHCRDTIGVQYASLGAKFTGVRLHTPYLAELVRSGRLQIEARPLEAAIHTPCKVVHNDEDATMEDLLRQAGVTLHHPPTMGFPTSCCGGGGGGFLWDSPAKVNKRRWEQIRETGQKRIVTGCPGCHRMLGILRDEETSIVDVSTVLLERVRRPGA
jgi:Fe-S oxidoreductase